MKREEILALCTSNPEAIVAYFKNLESQIKELRACLKINCGSTIEIELMHLAEELSAKSVR